MRKARLCAFAVILVAAAIAIGEIRQSHHDFSGAGWSEGRICLPCHTPHHADLTVAQSQLWNHEVTSATFTLYSSSTLDAALNQPGGASKLCLSCHDGTVAVDSFGGRQGSWISGFGNIGTTLDRHHPISFTYDSALALADGELHDPVSTPSGLGSTIDEDLLRNQRMECVSCHDVHVSRNSAGCVGCHDVHGPGGVITRTLSLRKDNSGSALCLTCHNK